MKTSKDLTDQVKIDLSRYEASKKYAQDMITTRYKDDIPRGIAMIASVTHCPAIVVAYYCGEVVGWDAVAGTIKSLVDFYGYSEIEGKPEGAP